MALEDIHKGDFTKTLDEEINDLVKKHPSADLTGIISVLEAYLYDLKEIRTEVVAHNLDYTLTFEDQAGLIDHERDFTEYQEELKKSLDIVILETLEESDLNADQIIKNYEKWLDQSKERAVSNHDLADNFFEQMVKHAKHIERVKAIKS